MIKIIKKKGVILIYHTDHISSDVKIIGGECIHDNFNNLSNVVQLDQSRSIERVQEIKDGKNDSVSNEKIYAIKICIRRNTKNYFNNK